MKTWKLTVNEEELRALIDYHAIQIGKSIGMSNPIYSVETSARIHDLTKRLNKKDEVEHETLFGGKTIDQIENEINATETKIKTPEGW